MKTEFIEIPTIEDYRGNIAVLDYGFLPFAVKRVYYLFDIPSTARRGGHAHKEQLEFLIAISGSFDLIFKSETETKTVTLNKPNKGILIDKNVWRELDNFSSGAVCLVLASDNFDENDYIRDFNSFIDYQKIRKNL
jgi:mannose-6-phosphate isomerase-like protein (cupin superfamily)